MSSKRTVFGALMVASLVFCCSGCGTLSGGEADIDDGFTIRLAVTGGATHIQQARELRKQLEQAGWENLMTIGGDGYTTLTWGTYQTVEDAAKDVQTAKAYTDSSGRRPFILAMTIPIPGKQIGKPEWDLRKAPGTYTVLVMTYSNDPKINFFTRKSKAAAQCAKFREEGYEAYYYHGPVKSHVTVGSFPSDSLKSIKGNVVRTEIRNPEMIRILKRFPELVYNDWGKAIWAEVKGVRKQIRARTFPVLIPTKPNEVIDINITASQWKRK